MAFKVLIVDDSRAMRLQLGEMLECLGCEVTEAENGLESVDLYLETKPDMVTMDILMPEQDGLETLRQIVAQDKAAKVIMVTSLGLGMNEYVKASLENGAMGCMLKPFSLEQVNEVLNYVKTHEAKGVQKQS